VVLKWIYKVKVNPSGEVMRHKTIPVAIGFLLRNARINYGEVYAPMARIETIQLVVVIATNAN